jgi:predicted dinucleotide-binding enzyme
MSSALSEGMGIVGAGRMGLAVARAVAATGEPVLVCRARPAAHPPPDLPPRCTLATLDDVWLRSGLVLLALPFPVALALMSGPAGRRGAGRTLIDATNPGLCPDAAVPPGRSGGELIAEAAPSWRVAKAFNTVPADQVAACRLGGAPVSLPVAGADPGKSDAFALARRLRFEPLDAGGIDGSRELESLAVLLMHVSAAHDLHGRIGVHIGEPRIPAEAPPGGPVMAAAAPTTAVGR